jgi:hypothetical protein
MNRKPDSDIDLMARGPSFERAAWLANMARVAVRRLIAVPTADDIQEMRKAIGDDPTFDKLSDTDKTFLFRALLTIRERRRIYSEQVKFEHEDPAPLQRALADLVATMPNYHGLLTAAADKMRENCGTTFRESWQTIRRLANDAEMLRQSLEDISEEVCQRRTGKPKVYNGHTIRRDQQRYETIAIRESLRAFGINIGKTGPGEHQGKGDAGLNLMACLIHFTSGRKPTLDALRTRLRRVGCD